MPKHIAITKDNALTLEITDPRDSGASYAAYLLDDRGICLAKHKYQTSNHFIFDHLPRGVYQVRLFCRYGANKKPIAWGGKGYRISNHMKNAEFDLLAEMILRGENFKENIQIIFSKYPACVNQIFNKMRDYRSLARINKEGALLLAESLFEIAQSASPPPAAQTIFAANMLALMAPISFLVKQEVEIMSCLSSAESIPDFEKKFSRGLIQYRIGNYLAAEREFQSIRHDDNVQFHQTGARSYFFRLPDAAFLSHNHPVEILKKCRKKTEGIVLVSCDYGYFKFYFERVLKKLNGLGNSLHVHVVLPRNVSTDELMHVTHHENLGISYEYETDQFLNKKNQKSYYAAVRYLILDKILNIYEQAVLVADINIDFNRPINHVFEKLKNDEIALSFGNVDMPWVKILAGFNFFGKNTKESEFLLYLKNYLWYCITTDRDGWMLDQVALNAAYQNISLRDRSRIVSMIELLGYTPVQYDDGQAGRAYAAKLRNQQA